MKKVALFVALGVVSVSTLFAQGPPSGAGQQSLVITSASVSGSTLHFEAQNACSSPTVKLGTITGLSATAATSGFDVLLPAGIAPATYLMSVSCGSGLTQNASLAVSLASGQPQQKLLDATGAYIGDVIRVESPGFGRATIRYSVNGSSVILNAVPTALSSSGTLVTLPNNTPQVFFLDADCHGDAYVTPFGAAVSQQFTSQQVLVLPNFLTVSQPPPPDPNSCTTFMPAPFGIWLYTASSTACPVQYSTSAFQAVYYQGGFGAVPSCAPIASLSPFQVPPNFTTIYTPFKRIEDLSRFKTPFQIQ